MEKEFDKWNNKKKELHTGIFHAYIHMREVWWCSLGLNIGFEEDGKNELFERPVLILKKFNNDIVLIVPLTSSNKENKYHVYFQHEGRGYSALVSQIRLVSTKRLQRRMYRMNKSIFGRIREAVKNML